MLASHLGRHDAALLTPSYPDTQEQPAVLALPCQPLLRSPRAPTQDGPQPRLAHNAEQRYAVGPVISLSLGPSTPHQVSTIPGACRQPSSHPAAPRNSCHGLAGSTAPALGYSHQHSAARSCSRAQPTPQQQQDFRLHQSSRTRHGGSKNKSSAHTCTFLYLLSAWPSPPLCSTLLFNDIFAQAYL